MALEHCAWHVRCTRCQRGGRLPQTALRRLINPPSSAVQRLIESRAMQSSLVHSAAPSAPLRRTAARLAARQRHRAALCCQASAANAPIR